MTTELVWEVRFMEPAARMTMNDRLHWRTRHRLTKIWRHTAHVHAANQLGRTPTARARGACLVRVSFPVPDPGRRRDPHNWAPTVKAIVDGLTDAGVWPDDNAAHVTVLDPTFYGCPRGVAGDVIVTLSPRAESPTR